MHTLDLSKFKLHFLALLTYIVTFGFLFQEVVIKLVHDWSTDDNYSHGFLIVPISLYLAWERRDRLMQAAIRPSWLGLLVVLGGVALLIAGTLGAELFVTRIGLLAVLAGSILFILGWNHLRLLVFPLALLVLSLIHI